MRTLRSAFIASATAVLASSSPALAKNCFDDSIRDVSQSGEVLVMLSGAVYEVMAGDEIDSALWLASDDVLICETSVPYQG